MFHKKVSLMLASSLMTLLVQPLTADDTAVSPEVKPAHAATAFTPFTGRVSGNRVRMRAQPKLESHVVRETAPGEMFAVVGEEKGYYVIQPSRGMKGYVFRTFILDGVVEGDRVNIRLFPDVDSPVIGQLHSGEKISSMVCSSNNKWLEVALPATTRFYVAKEYLDHAGPVELVLEQEAKREKAYHLLNAAFLYAQSELKKSFDDIKLDQIHEKFVTLMDNYSEFPDIAAQAKEADQTIEESYVQKKISFLESKADRTMATRDDAEQLLKLAQLGRDIKHTMKSEHMSDIGGAASSAMGHGFVRSDVAITDKMLVWQSFEESLYHLWAATHDGKSLDEFYEDEKNNAVVLTGIVEPFTKPVKNRPGDYLLKCENRPVAFLYSTKIDLNDCIGKKVTLTTTERPNNNFAFPAYFVLSVE